MRDKKTGLVDDLNDLKALAEAMRPGELTVISGSSDVGKTTLSLRIAQELVGPEADVAICLRRNADTGKCSYCMSRKVERSAEECLSR